MAPDQESVLYSVVIIGGMNPLIHHPSWYEHLGILTREETEAALQDAQTLTSPPAAQIVLAGLRIACVQGRWDVSATTPEGRGRILDIAARTFDTLEHTPVAAFGLNFNFKRRTHHPDSGSVLARLLEQLPIGLDSGRGKTGALTWKAATGPTNETSIEISGVPGAPSLVSIANNFHHAIEATGRFALGPLLREAWSSDEPSARSSTERVVAALNRLSRRVVTWP
jgi:hypothetical protein